MKSPKFILKILPMALNFAVLTLLSAIDEAQAFPVHKYGLIDISGQEILPCEYGSVTYLGNGLFKSTEFKEPGDLSIASPHLFDSNGKEISINVPAGARLLGVFIPRIALKSPQYQPGILPPGTLLEIEYRNITTLANLRGDILFNAPSLSIKHSQDGSLIVLGVQDPICAFDGETGEKIFDANLLRRYMLSQSEFGKLVHNRILFSKSESGRLLWGYYDANGNVALEPKYIEAKDFDEAGMAPVRYIDDSQARVFCFIDTSGKVLSPAIIVNADDWHQDLAVVTVKNQDGEMRKGIVNRKFEFVVKPEWKRLSYSAEDRYFGWIEDQGHSYTIDGKGVKKGGPFLAMVAYDAKKGAMLLQRWELDKEEKRLPSLTDQTGKTLFQNLRSHPEFLEHGMAVFNESADYRRRAVNSFTIVSDPGITASGVKAYHLSPATKDRLIKEVICHNFSTSAWKGEPADRVYLYSLFLRDHNLIGMTKNEVEQFLGRADSGNFYCMCYSWAAKHGIGMELLYEGDRVTGWRWVENNRMEPRRRDLVTRNVTYECDPFERYDSNASVLDGLKLVEKK